MRTTPPPSALRRARQAAPSEPDAGGDTARERLAQAALRLFAQQGFAQTSTRELAEAAQVNVAAISYYFGDKAGLYRAVFLEPMGDPTANAAGITDPSLTLPQALTAFFDGFLEPLREGEDARLCVKLHFREILEPTGLWTEFVEQGIRPLHDALVVVLQRELGLAAADDELHALAVAITALGVHLHVGHDVTVQIAPQLLQGPDAADAWRERLVRLARAMVDVERERRASERTAT